MKLDKILGRIRPLDLLMFKGADPFSRAIQVVEKVTTGDAEFSHVELVVNSELLPNIPQLKKNTLYTLASTIAVPMLFDEVPDARTGKCRFGVQIRELEPVVRKYLSNSDRRVAWCRLIKNPWLDTRRHKNLSKIASDFVNKYGFKPYEMNCIQLLATSFLCCQKVDAIIEEITVDGCQILSTMGVVDTCPVEEDVRSASIFCSELVAMILQAIGVIPKDVNPSRLSPIALLHPDKETKTNKAFPKFLHDPIHLDL